MSAVDCLYKTKTSASANSIVNALKGRERVENGGKNKGPTTPEGERRGERIGRTRREGKRLAVPM